MIPATLDGRIGTYGYTPERLARRLERASPTRGYSPGDGIGYYDREVYPPTGIDPVTCASTVWCDTCRAWHRRPDPLIRRQGARRDPWGDTYPAEILILVEHDGNEYPIASYPATAAGAWRAHVAALRYRLTRQRLERFDRLVKVQL